MNLTKADLIDSVFGETELQKQEAIYAVESLLEIIKHTLESGEDVLITRFGKFCVRDKEKRKGRNPQTGEDMTLRNRRVVAFKLSGKLKDKLNITQ